MGRPTGLRCGGARCGGAAVSGSYEPSGAGGRGDWTGELKVCRGYEICESGGGAALMRCQRLMEGWRGCGCCGHTGRAPLGLGEFLGCTLYPFF